MPKVSVVIPTYNRVDLLRPAIVSVLNQTFQDFEIIIVDDGCTDSTSDLVSAFNDARIKYIRHEINKGGSAARNTGILNSKCEFIAFLDDDDEWLPEKLDMQIKVIEESLPRVGGVYTSYIVVDRTDGTIIARKIPTKKGDLSTNLLVNNCIGATSSVLLRMRCFEEVGLFDEVLPSFQDYDMWIRISKKFHFEYIKEILFKYHIHKKKIWTDLDALERGIKIMLEKYGSSSSFRKNCSDYYLLLGVQHCYNGNVEKARTAFLRAIQLYPFEPRNYFNLFLYFFGSAKFTRVKKAKEMMVSVLPKGSMD